jgi:hypothetical protein
MTKHALYICKSCAFSLTQRDYLGERGGKYLFDRVCDLAEDWFLKSNFAVEELVCLSAGHPTRSPDTFRRVFEKIRPDEFERCFELWVQDVLDDLFPQLIAIDGKEIRSSYDREAGTKSVHLVSAWSSESQLVLAQTKVSSKSTEI